jgi:hypothetical protein
VSDEARIARLTELARRIVLAEEPDVDPRTVIVQVDHYANGDVTAYACAGRFVMADHPRALDALEAALLVLDGKDSPLSLEQAKDAWSDGFEAAKRLLAGTAVPLETEEP